MGAAVTGGITGLSGRVITGWLAADGAGPVGIELLSEGRLLGGTMAEPDGERLRFDFLLPGILFDGAAHAFGARVAGEIVVLEPNTLVLEAGEKILQPSGFLEKVTEEGWVVGWAWYPQAPDARAEIEILVDGLVAGVTSAGLYRADVAKAGFGEGCYGFSWPLPFQVLTAARDVKIAARDKHSGLILPQPLVFRQKAVADAFGRIAELESEVRLLNETIAGLERQGAAQVLAAGELFRTVGAFFSELAAAAEAGKELAPRRGVRSAVAEVTAGLAPFFFPVCEAPAVTVVVQAAASMARTYAGLRALRDGWGEAAAEIFLLDDGACEETALLPLVVQNMRYARLPGEYEVARCNDALRLGAGQVVLCVAAGVRLAGDWAGALDGFGAVSGLAALAGRVNLPDGTCLSEGVVLQGGEAVARGRWNAPEGGVDAVAPHVFAVRRSAWETLFGLDEQFAGLDAALVEFCLRARARHFSVGLAPGLAGMLDTAPPPPPLEDIPRLRAVIGSFRDAAD
jgi:hypothetical protein